MRLIILGAGGYGRTVADIAAQSKQFGEILFLDDGSDAPDVLGKCTVFAEHINSETVFYPAFGNNDLRLEWLERLTDAGCSVPTIVHPSAYVSPTAKINRGTVILPLASVCTSCVIGAGCIINCNSVVDHGCVLEDGIHIAPGAIVKAENHLPRCMKVDSGEVIGTREYYDGK